MTRSPRHLYVHVPFCAHRCGYCDFVTTSAMTQTHERYVDGLQRELDVRWPGITDEAPELDTVFVGGGTPTLLAPEVLGRLVAWLRSMCATGAEVTVECNPETVTDELANVLVSSGATRVSLGAQSFSAPVLATLERRADPDTVHRAVEQLRAAGVGQLSLDVIWGVPGQSLADVERDVAELAAIAPDHVSAYELEFKPGTRLTRRFGSAGDAVGEQSDDHYDAVVDGLGRAGYAWYETANFARADSTRCRHNLAYWRQRDHVGIGIGAVGTIGEARRTNLPNIARWLESVERGDDPPARIEVLDGRTRRVERIMLALRIAEPCVIPRRDIDDGIVSADGIARVVQYGLGEASTDPATGDVQLVLGRRGRMLLNSVIGAVTDA